MFEKVKKYLVSEKRRIGMTIFGVCICGISVGFFKFSNLGVDPFQVLAHGIWGLTNIGFGVCYNIINILMLVGIFFINRRKIGLGTLINIFLLGYMAEYSEKVLYYFIPDPKAYHRYIALIIGIVVMCFASAFYFTADLGVSTYDAIAITIDERTSDKVQFRYVRIATDLICVVAGIICWKMAGKTIAEIVGVGTIITAFFMGPLIDLFKKKAAIPFLNRGKEALKED